MQQQREVRFSSSRPVIHEPLHSRQTSDSNLTMILEMPLPTVYEEQIFEEIDPWTAASLNVRFLRLMTNHSFQGYKPAIEIMEDQQKIERPFELELDEVSTSNEAGWTPLMYAAYLGHIESVKRLLDLNVNVEQRNSSGQTALMLAASCGNDQMVSLFVWKILQIL